MKIAWHNRIDECVLSIASEDTLYPINNIKDIRLPKIWKATGTTTQTIIIDCVTAVSLGCIAIIGHNLTGATVSIQGNSSSDFTTPAFSYTFLAAEIEDIIYFLGDNMTAYRYWAIKIESATVIPYIGYVHLDYGDFLEDQLATSITPIEFNNRDIFEISDSGSLFGYKNSIILKSFQIIFEDISYTEYAELITFLEYVGKVLPLIIIWNAEDIIPGIKNIYCHIKDNFKIPKIAGQNRFDYSLIVEEIK